MAMTQNIIAVILVTAAVAYLVYTGIRKVRKGGCDCSSSNCDCAKCDGCSLKENCKMKNKKS